MYVAVDGSYAGTVVISDELRSQAVEAVSKLREKAGYVAILMGDNEASARETAKITGTDGLCFSLLPAKKLGIRKERGVTAFVGDGINDTPVLAEADAGCTIGLSSTDAAVEAANLMPLPQTIDLA